MARRGFLVQGIALAAAAPRRGLASLVQPDLRFEVMRNGSRIGQHSIRFRQEGTTLEAEFVVDIAVRLGPIVLYRYAMRGREVWREGAFASLESETNDDGTRHRVKATRTPDQVVVEVSGALKTIFPSSAIPLTRGS